MSNIYLDVRGKACPQPVVETKKALDQVAEGMITVHLNAEPSAVNVSRFAISQGCTVTRKEEADGSITLEIIKGFSCEIPASQPTSTAVQPAGNLVIYINDQYMGKGDVQLGKILMKAFLKTLIEVSIKPRHLIFVNSAVYLTCAGSEELATITTLEQEGTTILSCGTCLDFYHLKDRLQVGQMSNMFEIASLLLEATQVVTP
ncbi:MAG: sulfurtransferase-like selenium metabolism protein YedF [Deltaproteobacteria bacterium]|nr:sulfurtransferase-like selenium metabolism protein YedF [Candidatus Anaeroferrophillus wilburensis]MBN2890140.1 sulfurtransferase-like selenium metabolism protein YedF [Deltaproteobacteria bacterium]